MLLIKDNTVKSDGTTRELWFGIGVAMTIFAQFGHDLIITSMTDGEHNPGSLHPKGLAADFRVKHVTTKNGRLDEPVVAQIFHEIRTLLQPHGFDVVWEGGVGATPMTTGAHIHIEYDPHPGEDNTAPLKQIALEAA
jgi:hypothetical protein